MIRANHNGLKGFVVNAKYMYLFGESLWKGSNNVFERGQDLNFNAKFWQDEVSAMAAGIHFRRFYWKVNINFIESKEKIRG